MSIELLLGHQRLALAISAGVFVTLALVLRWRRVGTNWVVGAVAAAVAAALVLAGEQAAAWLVRLSAPDAVDFNEYRWIVRAPWGQLGLALGGAVAAVVMALSWLASARIRSPWRRAMVVGLRTAAVATAFVVFLEPAVELRQVAREPNRIAVLVDDSLSMSLRDRGDGPSRFDRAKMVLASSSDTFETWRRDHLIDFYTFSAALSPLSLESLGPVEPAGKASLFRQSLTAIRANYEGTDLAGIVLLSDGIATGDLAAGGTDGASRVFMRSLGTRVHTVWTGRPGLKDVAVAKVLADEFAFARTVVKVDAVVRSTGYARRQIPVTLSESGAPLRRKWVTVGGDTEETTVTFEFTPARVGRYVYSISTPIEDDEAVAENNARAFVVRVIRDKIRVLQVAGRPSWDVRALRGMLKQNPNVDLISFFILRTQEDLPRASNDELSLIPFPTRELFEQELPSFDLVVLQDFNFDPYGIRRYLENIRAYVHGGGGLVMLGGDLSFASGGYTGTPVAEALPVTLPNALGSSALLDTQRFSPALTELGEVHPITALRYETAENRKRWAELPPLGGINFVQGARKDASVLATHPRIKTRDGKPMPVIVAGDYGDGRTLAVTTDSLWRWGFVAAARRGDQGRAYTKFWENATRWLTQDPDLRYLHIDSDKVEYEPGESVRLDVRLLARNYTPLGKGSVRLEIRRGADPQATVDVEHTSVQTDAGGLAQHELPGGSGVSPTNDGGRARLARGRDPGLDAGVYRVTARAKVDGRKLSATDIFLVREASAELARPAADPDLLDVIATVTGGRALGKASEIPVDLEFAEPRIVRVDRRQDVELWSGPWLLGLALLLLGLEWGLRRRSGYL